MGKYSIKELERLSGIKAHTIRIWEKRYNLIQPSRTDTNIRYYNDSQLRKILNVSSLVNMGYRISKVSQMSAEEMVAILEDNLSKAPLEKQKEIELHQLIEPCMNFDEPLLDERINELIGKSSLIEAFTDIFFPLLNRIGFLWATSRVTPAHEHFLSNKLMQVLFSSMTMRSELPPDAKKYLLFLPEWEEHEMLLLFCSYVLKKHSKGTIYIGKRVPSENLLETIDQSKPDYLITTIISPNFEKEVQKYFAQLATHPSLPPLIVGGNMSYGAQMKDIKNMHWVQNVEQLVESIFV